MWQQITEFSDENTARMPGNQWNFKYLEVVGQRFEFSQNIDDICNRIPMLKIETRTRYVKPEGRSRLAIDFTYKPPKRSKHPPKPAKEKVVTVKVVLPKKPVLTLRRSCICTCEGNKTAGESPNIGQSELYKTSTELDKDMGEEEVSFEELLDILQNYDNGIHKEASSAIRNLVRRFRGGKILSEDEAIQVLKMLDTNNPSVQEGVVILIQQLCSVAVNSKMLLEYTVLDDLVYLLFLGATTDVQIAAATCIAKLTEREEHADLWLETMVISGTEALFGVLTAAQETVPERLRNAVLEAVNNLARHPKMAPLLIEFGLQSAVDLMNIKNEDGKATSYPAAQMLVTRLLTNLLSHNCTTVELFISKHDDAVTRVVNLLQYGKCPQQQEAARFLAALTLFKPGLDPIVSHHASEHLMWAMTCSHCRFVRDHASRALKNITDNSDKEVVLEALSQFSMSRVQQETNACTGQCTLTNSAALTEGRRTLDEFLKNPSCSKLEKIMAELTSVLALTFQTDSLSLYGASRTLLKNETVKERILSSVKKGAGKISSPDERYLSSLRVLTNTLVAMANLVRLKDKDDSGKEISCTGGPGANLSLTALLIQYGGLRFINQLQFLSSKLQQVNPQPFHEIDPATLPPKELISTLKNARTELIFDSSKPKKEPRKHYPDFGFHSTELHFVQEAVNFLLLVVEATVCDFDPSREDVNIFDECRPIRTLKRKHISFKTSANIVKNAVSVTWIAQVTPQGRKSGQSSKNLKRQSSSRSVVSSSNGSLAGTSSSPRSSPSLPRNVSSSATSSATVDLGSSSQDEMVHYVKQSLLDAKVVLHLAPWVTCGVYDIQSSVIKLIRYLMHAKHSSKRGNNQSPNSQPKEAWGQRKPPAAQTRHSTLSQRSSVSMVVASKTKSAHLGHMCVRHVVQYCGAYLLDLLGPPAAPILGRLALMVIREAVVNGENDSRLKFVKLGCFARIIDYIRGNEDGPHFQALGLVVTRSLVARDQALKQLFFAHGGMSLVMALHEYKKGLVKDEAANTLLAFAKVTSPSQMTAKSKRGSNNPRKRTRSSNGDEDVWDQIADKWKTQDKVTKVLKKFNVRY